jgi:WD40 repeat protein
VPSGRPVVVLPPPADPAEIGYMVTGGGRVVLVARTGASEHWVFDVQEMRELPVDSGPNRSVLRSIRGSPGARTHVRFYASPRGEPAVAVQYSGRTAVVWDLAVGRPLGTWPASEQSVPVRLASGEHVTVPLHLEDDPDLRGTGLQQLGDPRTTRASPEEPGQLGVTPTGRFLRVEFNNVTMGLAGSVILAGHTGDVTGYDFASVPDGYVVVTASLDGTVRRWDIDWSRARSVGGDDRSVPDRAVLAVSRIVSTRLDDGASVGLASDADGNAALWDLRTGEFMGDIRQDLVSAIAVGRMAGEPVAIIANPGSVVVMQLPGRNVVSRFGGRLWWPNAIASVSLPDGSDAVVTTGHGRKAVVWDPATGRMRKVLAAHRGWSSCVTHAQGAGNRPLVLTGGFDNRVNVWDISRGWHRRFRIVKPWTFLTHPSAGLARAIRTLRLPNGRMLVLVATLDGMVRALEAPDTMRRAHRTGATMAEVVSSATLTSGLLVVITVTDGIVRVWDAAAFPPVSGITALCEINIEVPVTDIGVTDHDIVVLATPNGLTAIRLGTGSLMGQADQPLRVS